MTSFDNKAVPGIVNEFLAQSLRKIHQEIFSLGILIKITLLYRYIQRNRIKTKFTE